MLLEGIMVLFTDAIFEGVHLNGNNIPCNIIKKHDGHHCKLDCQVLCPIKVTVEVDIMLITYMVCLVYNSQKLSSFLFLDLQDVGKQYLY